MTEPLEVRELDRTTGGDEAIVKMTCVALSQSVTNMFKHSQAVVYNLVQFWPCNLVTYCVSGCHTKQDTILRMFRLQTCYTFQIMHMCLQHPKFAVQHFGFVCLCPLAVRGPTEQQSPSFEPQLLFFTRFAVVR